MTRRQILFGLAIGVGVGLLAVMEWGLDYGHRHESCERCGARSHVRHRTFFGFGGEYGRVIAEGPVSKFIQAHEGRTCSHQWRAFDMYGGGFLLRWAGTGGGGALTRDMHVSSLEGYLGVSITDVLERNARKDPQFADRFTAAIRDPDEPASEAFLDALMEELVATDEYSSRPASPPATSATAD